MALKKKPVTGMKDILPQEMEIRDYLIGLIKETYRSYGFQSMETPCVEHIENLCSKQGGDNEKLIFKIMKRGEKLNLETAQSEADLVDGGLRGVERRVGSRREGVRHERDGGRRLADRVELGRRRRKAQQRGDKAKESFFHTATGAFSDEKDSRWAASRNCKDTLFLSKSAAAGP